MESLWDPYKHSDNWRFPVCSRYFWPVRIKNSSSSRIGKPTRLNMVSWVFTSCQCEGSCTQAVEPLSQECDHCPLQDDVCKSGKGALGGVHQECNMHLPSKYWYYYHSPGKDTQDYGYVYAISIAKTQNTIITDKDITRVLANPW